MVMHARANRLVVLMFDVRLWAHERTREWVSVRKVCGCEGVINTSHNPRVVVTLANS